LHIGNYLGALKNFVDLQDSGKYDCYFCIVDLHSLTGEFEAKEKPAQILDLAADFFAAGLDPKTSTVFQQSRIPAHSELTWILNTMTPMGELERMTQFKDKSSRQAANINVGLFDYPVLMAADVILYDAAFVPVGDDQLQHLELMRTIARKFNARFGKTFLEPKAVLTKTPRVMSLKDPEKKMSKSVPDGCLFLDDTPEAITYKVSRAVTDSGSEIVYDPKGKPGLSNLLEIYGGLIDTAPAAAAKALSGEKYSAFKKRLAEVVIERCAPFRERKKALLAKPEDLKKMLAPGAAKASRAAEKKIKEVYEKVGLIL